MSTTVASPQVPPAAPSSRARKIRAVLAGGLVLGIGAAVTLAAWNDSENATGTFAAGQFNLEGSTDGGGTWGEHPDVASAAPLAFTLNPENLAPDDVVYAPFAVRLDATTTNDATVTLAAAGTTGVITNLTYTLVSTTGTTCDADAVAGGTALVPAGTAVGTVPAAPTFPLTAGDGAAGTPVNLCFAVTAGEIEQGQTGTATWEFGAESTS